MLRLATLVFLLAAPAAAAELSIAPAGAPETVYRWATDRCATTDIPDAPARAFRDAARRVVLFAAHFDNRAFAGPDLSELRHDCRPRFASGEKPRPELFDDRSWLASFYTLDGGTVFALVHDEFQGHRHAGLCPSGRYRECWYNAITAAVSHDGGASFAAASPNRLVAALPYRYDPARGRHVGYFTPTNILRKDGRWYAMIFATPLGAQQHGACLIRTDDLADPAAWRAWDGTGFANRFIDPYRTGASGDETRHVCAPVGKGVLRWPVSSLVRHVPSGLYIATFLAIEADGSGGFRFATSRDLVAWTPGGEIMPGKSGGRWRCGDEKPVDYPSLLDPASPSRNFETVGDSAFLFFTRNNVPDCRIGMDRDLLRITVRIAVGG